LKFGTLVGMGLIAMPDVATGILIIHIVGKLLSYNIPIYFYPIGMFLSLLPDANLVLMLIRKEKSFYGHRKLDHCPLVILSIVLTITIVLYLLSILPGFWVIVVNLCLFGHFVHDSIEYDYGRGLQWLYPLGKKYYKLFGRKDGKRRVIVSYNEDLADGQEPLSMEQEINKYWLKLNRFSLSSIVTFLIAVAVYFVW